MIDPGDPGDPIEPDPDNADPWCAGYCAGLRASGSTFVSDDNVDPRVVLVRMLPDEYLDSAISRPQLIELKGRVAALTARVDAIDDRRAAVKEVAARVAARTRRMTRLAGTIRAAALRLDRHRRTSAHDSGTSCSPVNSMKKGTPLPHPDKNTRGVEHAAVYDSGGSSPKSPSLSRPAPGDPDPFRHLTGSIAIAQDLTK